MQISWSKLCTTVAQVHEWAYGFSDDNVWIHMYGASEFEADLKGEKNDDLYEELPEMAAETVKISMIPYYTWSNRGCCDMSVWLPLV